MIIPEPAGRHARFVARLARLPRPLVFLAVLGLALLALFSDGVLSAAALLVLAAGLAVLASISWPLATSAGRAARVIAVAALVGVALARAL